MMNRKKAAPTPPMGWNSWDCYGAGVSEQALLQNAAFLQEHLLPYGWKYVVCDIQWYEPAAADTRYHPFADLCMDEYSRLLPAPNRFPSAAGGKGFAPIAEKIHDMGLLFGIHILRGIPRQAVHRNTALLGTAQKARDIASAYSLCPWNSDMYGVDMSREGAQAYYDSLFELYASWGVDFVKVDDICNTEYKPAEPYSAKEEIEAIRRAIDRCGREMVLSLSPGPAPLEQGWHLSANADMWRLTGDFWDEWEKLDDMFERCARWYPFSGSGCWPDCDMLPLGRLCVTDRRHGERLCRLTRDEQKTMMNLWCIFRSPLMLGAATEHMDEFTLSLLTNGQVLRVNQEGKNQRPVRHTGDEAVWQSFLPDGMAVALFNRSDKERRLSLAAGELGLDAFPAATDLWSGERILPHKNALSLSLAPHGSVMLFLPSMQE